MNPLNRFRIRDPYVHNLWEKLLPEPEDVENVNGKWGARIFFDKRDVARWDQNELHFKIQDAWLRLYEKVNSAIARMMIGRDDYYVIRIIPRVQENIATDQVSLSLIAEVFMAETQNIRIPKIIYDDNLRPVEWRCGHCNTPNPMSARFCGEKFDRAAGCGAPRAKLIQEM